MTSVDEKVNEFHRQMMNARRTLSAVLNSIPRDAENFKTVGDLVKNFDMFLDSCQGFQYEYGWEDDVLPVYKAKKSGSVADESVWESRPALKGAFIVVIPDGVELKYESPPQNEDERDIQEGIGGYTPPDKVPIVPTDAIVVKAPEPVPTPEPAVPVQSIPEEKKPEEKPANFGMGIVSGTPAEAPVVTSPYVSTDTTSTGTNLVASITLPPSPPVEKPFTPPEEVMEDTPLPPRKPFVKSPPDTWRDGAGPNAIPHSVKEKKWVRAKIRVGSLARVATARRKERKEKEKESKARSKKARK